MASRLIIQNITGTTPYYVYVCDVFETLCEYLGVLTGTTLGRTFTLSSLYDTAPIIRVKLIDNNGCEVKKDISCDENCTFQLEIYSVDDNICLASPTPTPTVTPTITPSITPTPSVTPTVTPTTSITPTPTVTPTITPTPSPTCPAAASIVSDGLVAYLDPAICNGFTQATNTLEDATGNFSGDNFDLRAYVRPTTSTSTLYTGTSIYSNIGGGSLTISASTGYFYEQVNPYGYSAYSFSIWFYPFNNITSATSANNLLELRTYPNASGIQYLGLGNVTGPSVLNGEIVTILGDYLQPGNTYPRTAVMSSAFTQFSANTWYNVTCNWNSGSSRYDIYINNILRTVVNSSGGNVPVINANLLVVGAVWGDGQISTTARNIFTGNIGEMHFYNKALTGAELTQNYDALKTRYGY